MTQKRLTHALPADFPNLGDLYSDDWPKSTLVQRFFSTRRSAFIGMLANWLRAQSRREIAVRLSAPQCVCVYKCVRLPCPHLWGITQLQCAASIKNMERNRKPVDLIPFCGPGCAALNAAPHGSPVQTGGACQTLCCAACLARSLLF